MQPEENIDDLDYLAERGFEQVPLSEADLADLRQRVKTRSFSYNNGFYFAGICLLAGIFIGLSLFFVAYEPVPERGPLSTPDVVANNTTHAAPAVTVLDTVAVTPENFVSPKPRVVVAVDSGLTPTKASYADSLPVELGQSADVSQLLQQPLKEEKIKFIANAPVTYIHDLKVTNYSSLYFKKNQFVRLGGIDATYATRQPEIASHLKESASYFLHTELANGLLYFKKGQYDRCLVTLAEVATHNDDDMNCDFYMGMSYYYKHNFAKALELLDRCIGNANNTFWQEATYYKALCLYEQGNTTAARQLLKQIIEEESFYAEKAKAFLAN